MEQKNRLEKEYEERVKLLETLHEHKMRVKKMDQGEKVEPKLNQLMDKQLADLGRLLLLNNNPTNGMIFNGFGCPPSNNINNPFLNPSTKTGDQKVTPTIAEAEKIEVVKRPRASKKDRQQQKSVEIEKRTFNQDYGEFSNEQCNIL